MSLFGSLFGSQSKPAKDSVFAKTESALLRQSPQPASQQHDQPQHQQQPSAKQEAKGKKRAPAAADRGEGEQPTQKPKKKQRAQPDAGATQPALKPAANGAAAEAGTRASLKGGKQGKADKVQQQPPRKAPTESPPSSSAESSESEDEAPLPRKQAQQQRQQQQVQQQQQPKARKAQVKAAAQAAEQLRKQEDGSEEGSSSGDEEEAEASGSQEGQEEGGSGRQEEDSQSTRKQLTPEEQAEKLQRTIFVGNVPAKLKLKTLKNFFSKYGEVESARLRRVPVDLKCKLPRKAAIYKHKVDDERAPAVAYVCFKDASSVEPALGANMSELGGNHLRVDRAAPPAKAAAQDSHQFDPTRSLFVGNLHFATLDEELIQFFTGPEALEGNAELSPAANGGQCAIEGVRIVRDPATSLNKGFGFVLFRTKAAVRAALSLNGRPLRARPLRLTRVSVQQQRRLQVQRSAMAAPSKPTKQQGKAGSSGGSSSKGGAAGKAGLDPALWQGTQTKGKAKGVRGTKAAQLAGRVGKQSGGSAGSNKRDGKRPAVAKKKQKQLAAKAQKKQKLS